MEDNSKDKNFLSNNDNLLKVAELNDSDVNFTKELEKDNLNEEIMENVSQQIFDKKDHNNNFQNLHDKQISELDLDQIENTNETVPVKHLEMMTNALANDEITDDDLQIGLNMEDDIIDNQININKNITDEYQNFYDKQIPEPNINEEKQDIKIKNINNDNDTLKEKSENKDNNIPVSEIDMNMKAEEAQNQNEKSNELINNIGPQTINHNLTSDVLVEELETVNDDFVQEFKEEKEKQLLEEKKKAEIEAEEHKEDTVKFTPIIEEEKKQNDLANLNLDNIEDFLKKNSKNIENKKYEKVIDEQDFSNISEKKVKNDETNNNDEIDNKNLIKDIKLNEELWDELNLSEDLKNKIKIRVRMEIKTFLMYNLIPILEKIIRRI